MKETFVFMLLAAVGFVGYGFWEHREALAENFSACMTRLGEAASERQCRCFVDHIADAYPFYYSIPVVKNFIVPPSETRKAIVEEGLTRCA